MKLIKQVLLVLVLLFANYAIADPEAGKDYQVLSPAQPTHSGNKIEVLEFFFYGCIHCYHLNPLIGAWEKQLPKDVEFTYVPAIFNPTWEVSARTFYALEFLGIRAKLHDDLFNAWNSNIELVDEATTTDFLAKHGVDSKKFGDAYNSFSMQSQVLRAKQMEQTYGIRGTPTLVVDGKYIISGLRPEDTMQVLNALVDKARKERRTGKK
ncbi:MAG: thiol:disulfide interchange protein DsbA/DsbL [Nitrosomonadales bacterium]